MERREHCNQKVYNSSLESKWLSLDSSRCQFAREKDSICWSNEGCGCQQQHLSTATCYSHAPRSAYKVWYVWLYNHISTTHPSSRFQQLWSTCLLVCITVCAREVANWFLQYKCNASCNLQSDPRYLSATTFRFTIPRTIKMSTMQNPGRGRWGKSRMQKMLPVLPFQMSDTRWFTEKWLRLYLLLPIPTCT